MKADYQVLSRTYFPGVDFSNFTLHKKKQVEEDIAADFSKAYEGIRKLPMKARFGVYVAYKYYLSLFDKIKNHNHRYCWKTASAFPIIPKPSFWSGRVCAAS